MCVCQVMAKRAAGYSFEKSKTRKKERKERRKEGRLNSIAS